MQTTTKSFFNNSRSGIIKFLTVLAILFSISAFVFGAGINENQSTEILITENDRMTVEFNSFDITTLIFKGYDYKKQVFQSVYKIDYKYTELGKLFMLVGLKAVRSYELYLNKYRNEEPASTDFNEIKRYAKQLNQLLIQAIKHFNEYIASSQENRKKIAAILQERYNFEQQSNQAEQRIKQNNEESIQNYQGKGSILLGLNLEANLFTSSVGYPGSHDFGIAVSIGSSFAYFFGSGNGKTDFYFGGSFAFLFNLS